MKGGGVVEVFFFIRIRPSQWGKELELGSPVDDVLVAIQLYADDIALKANNGQDCQTVLCKTLEWCQKWTCKVNISKTKLVLFGRSPSVSRSN